MRREPKRDHGFGSGLVNPLKALQLAESSHRDDSAGDVDVRAAIANYSFGTNTRVCARVFGLDLTF